MIRSFKLRPAAQTDVRQIWDTLTEIASVETADRLLAHFHDACRMLGERPGLGHKRPDLTDRPMLFWTVGDYYVIYHPETVPLEIERIIYGGRDLKKELQ